MMQVKQPGAKGALILSAGADLGLRFAQSQSITLWSLQTTLKENGPLCLSCMLSHTLSLTAENDGKNN
jgi:hypothetical protein